jgi:hypothetical protein
VISPISFCVLVCFVCLTSKVAGLYIKPGAGLWAELVSDYFPVSNGSVEDLPLRLFPRESVAIWD